MKTEVNSTDKNQEDAEMEKKYGFTGATKQINGQTFHEIIALKDFGNVGAGEVGGYIASEKCLSQQGDCWVDKDSHVDAGAEVWGDAMIINSHIYEYSNVCEDAIVDDAHIFSCTIKGNAFVHHAVFLYGIFGKDAHVENKKDYLSIKGLGTESRLTTAYKTADRGVRIACGCFNGNVEEFRVQVKETRTGKIAEEYLMFADLVEKYFSIEKKPLNTQFVVLEASGTSLTKGKIYKVVNGKFKDDSGEMFPYNSKLYSYKDLENYFDPSIKYMGHYYFGVTKIMEIVE